MSWIDSPEFTAAQYYLNRHGVGDSTVSHLMSMALSCYEQGGKMYGQAITDDVVTFIVRTVRAHVLETFPEEWHALVDSYSKQEGEEGEE